MRRRSSASFRTRTCLSSRSVKRTLGITFCAAILLAGGLFVWSTIPPRTLPSFAEVRTAWCPSDVRVLDRHGEVIYETRTDPVTRRLAWASLPEISPSFVAAVVASEDRRFREHHGVDWKAVLSAVRQRIEGSGPRGASTITMQLAALLDRSLSRGHGGRSLDEKWEQMRQAWALERAWTK